MLKLIVRTFKNVTNGYSLVQRLVRLATSNDALGPTTYDMEEIAHYTYSSQTDFLEIMDMLDRRLNDKGKYWRHTAKLLTVLDYLVRFGLEKCVLWAKDNLYIIKTLREFIYFDDNNVDQGALIRVKAKELVLLLQDDERLRMERANKAKGGDEFGGRRRKRSPTDVRRRDGNDPYDSELEKALELSRRTAEEEAALRLADTRDPELEAALKLSMEEEEMRRQNNNLLDLDQSQTTYFMPVQAPDQLLQQQQTAWLQQQEQQAWLQQQQQQQQQALLQQQQQNQFFDMFGNPIQNQMTTGQPQQPAFTGFHQPGQMQPLKTGLNNPFALNQPVSPQPAPDLLNALAQQQQMPLAFTNAAQGPFSHQPQHDQQQQPVEQQLKPQNTLGSRYGDHTHSELNNLLAQGTGIDTFGNTGDARIPHQHTKTGTFVNSQGTGYRQETSQLVRLSTNATGNPFLNTGIGYQGQQQPQPQPPQQPLATGYGFGNQGQGQGQGQNKYNGEGPSLIDI